MANIVELRGMNDEKLEELLENAREEMFNLRFQKAASTLEDVSRIKTVRREISQLQTVLNMRQLAVDAAAAEPDIASVLDGAIWQANARFIYEESAWQVVFQDEDENELVTAYVDLNKKRPSRKGKATLRLVTDYEIAG